MVGNEYRVDDGILIKTYKDLRKVVRKFKQGTFDLLIIVGPPGIGKTFNTKNILGKSVRYINNHVTVLGLYQTGYENQDTNLWLDDVESLFSQDKMIGLLKQFCETLPEKSIQYNTSWNLEKCRKVPKQYTTKSKVLMTCNSLTRIKNKGVQSLLDRALIFNFSPDAKEICLYIKKNMKGMYDPAVIDLLVMNDKVSLRNFVKVKQLKDAGLLHLLPWEGVDTCLQG